MTSSMKITIDDADEQGLNDMKVSVEKLEAISKLVDPVDSALESGHALYKSFTMSADECHQLGTRGGVDRYVVSVNGEVGVAVVRDCKMTVMMYKP